MSSNRALVIGIDDYPGHALGGCVNDATEIAALLRRNEDKSKNFEVQLITSQNGPVGNAQLIRAISSFFNSSNPAETAVLYFAGHGTIDSQTDSGYILGSDAGEGAPGMDLSQLMKLANKVFPIVQSSVIILDCCHAGSLGQKSASAEGGSSDIDKGVTILSACNSDQAAKEVGRHGVFTDLLIDALEGGCADLRGRITPAAVYTHIDQSLGFLGQRPLYKANVHKLITLRQMLPKIDVEVLRRLEVYFKDPDFEYQLDSSYEPDRQYVSGALELLPVNPEHAVIFGELQQYNRQGLVVPIGVKHMFEAAIQSKRCKLTAMGKHYRRLAVNDML